MCTNNVVCGHKLVPFLPSSFFFFSSLNCEFLQNRKSDFISVPGKVSHETGNNNHDAK